MARRLWLCLLLCLTGAAPAQDGLPTGFLDRVHQDESGSHRYVVFVPAETAGGKPLPVILYLHGAGGRGNDGRRHLGDGLAPIIRLRQADFPAIVVFPQCEDTTGPLLKCWLAESPDARRALRILNEVEREFPVDPGRRVLTGWSMGGYGAWSVAAATPDLWAGVVPISGGGDPQRVATLKDVPLWAVHGGRDGAILPAQSERMIKALRQAGGNPAYTEATGVGHEVWKHAYASDVLQRWMLDPRHIAPEPERLANEIERLHASDDLDELDRPFTPALIMPRAISLRRGNESLQTLSYGIPAAMRPEMLTGELQDLTFPFDAQGEHFDVRLADLKHTARVARAEVQAQRQGCVRLLLGVHIELTIARTEIEGQRRRARAGPVRVTIGHRRPVWLDLMLRPAVAGNRLSLHLDRSRFSIPDDNWLVKAPETVVVEGPDITAEAVSDAIVGGLYVHKADFEAQVNKVIPSVVERIEDRLAPEDAERLVRGIWPLPVYEPRLRLGLDDVSVDDEGISLVLDVSAAPVIAGMPPGEPRRVSPLGPPASEVPRSRDLQVGIAEGFLEPLAQMLIDADAARISVADLPDEQFASLADPARLVDVIPDLRRFGSDVRVRTELSLAAPFSLGPSSDSAASGVEGQSLNVSFRVPQLRLQVALQQASEPGEWQPYAELELGLTQQVVAHLQRPASDRRALQLEWSGALETRADGRLLVADNGTDPTIHAERLAGMFRDAWRSWTTQQPDGDMQIPDVGLGGCVVRLNDVHWAGPQIVATFRTPATQIVNRGGAAVQYEVRGPYSAWGRPRSLAPGEVHEYDVPYPLTVRRWSDTSSPPATFPVGSVVVLPQLAPALSGDISPERLQPSRAAEPRP